MLFHIIQLSIQKRCMTVKEKILVVSILYFIYWVRKCLMYWLKQISKKYIDIHDISVFRIHLSIICYILKKKNNHSKSSNGTSCNQIFPAVILSFITVILWVPWKVFVYIDYSTNFKPFQDVTILNNIKLKINIWNSWNKV